MTDDFVPFQPLAEARSERRPPIDDQPPVAEDQRLLGTLVHRLVHRFGFDGSTHPQLGESARQLLRPEEASQVDAAIVARAAADYYVRLCSRPDVRTLYDAKRALFEVPFSSVLNGRRTRGVIDCLVASESPGPEPGLKHLTLIELKTGSPRPEHHEQVSVYRAAATSIFPGIAIDTVLVYPDHVVSV